MLMDDVHDIWQIMDDMIDINKKAGIEDGNIAIAQDNVPLLSKVIEKTRNIIMDDNGLRITREIVEEFAHYGIVLSMYNSYADMIIYLKYKDIGIEVASVPKKDLIS
jgi:hypothetical protein